MENVLIDERRIHVDFSQSVAKLWNTHRRKTLKQAAQQILQKEQGQVVYPMAGRRRNPEQRRRSRERRGRSKERKERKRHSRSRSLDRKDKKRRRYSSSSSRDSRRRKHRRH